MTIKHKDEYIRECQILEWIDGDTVDILIDLGCDTWKKERVRLYGVNCAETRTKDLVEKERGKNAKAFALSMNPLNCYRMVQTVKSGNEKFGRYLAKLFLHDGRSFSDILIETGHGSPYFGEKRE